MNDDDNEPYEQPRGPAKPVYVGVPNFSNPFTKIAHETQAADTTKGVWGKERHMEMQVRTPQKLRPFQATTTTNRDKISALSPYVNFLKGSKSTSTTPVMQFQSHNFPPFPPMTPRGLSSSPLQGQCLEVDPTTAPGVLDNTGPPSDENVFDELKDVYKTLAEQTKQSESLRYQIISLKNARNNLAREHAQTTQELERTKTQMCEATARTGTLQSQLEKSEEVLGVKMREIMKMSEEARGKTEENEQLLVNLEKGRREVEDVKKAYNAEVGKGEELEKRVEETNRRIRELVIMFGGLEKEMLGLGESQTVYHRLVGETTKDLTNLRRLSSETAGKILDQGDSRQLLAKARATLAELKDELADSQRVNDFLRDKLHHTSTQLAEVTGQLHELETEKREVWEDTLRNVSQNVQLQESLIASNMRTAELVERLRAFEDESFGLLSRSAELEAKMDEIGKQNSEKDAELVILRPLEQERSKLQAEVADLTQRLTDETISRKKLQGRMEESRDALISAEKESLVIRTQIQDVMDSRREVASELSSLKIAYKEMESNLSGTREKFSTSEKELQARYDTKLSSIQEMLGKRDQEISALQAKYALGEDMREQLRTALSREQAISTRLQQDLKETTIREAIALGKVDAHEGRIVNLVRELASKEDMLRQLDSKVASAQERCEAQASTLRLTKEELGDVQERLLSTGANNEAALGALRLEIAVLQERKSSLSVAVEKLSLDLKTREEVFVSKTKELQGKIATQREEIQKLGNVKEEYVTTAEREVMKAKKREEELKEKVVQLEGVVDRMNLLMREEVERARTLEKDRVLELEGKVTALTTQNEELRKEKEECVEKQNTLLERYAAGDLADIEKDFISLLIQNARDLHEQAAITKDNEIKRRDTAISALQERIVELEITLAQVFQPASADPSLILGLKVSPPVSTRSLDSAPVLPLLQQPPPPPISAGAPVILSGALHLSHELDVIPPIPSQIASELSTPPQSPQPSRARVAAVSFVQLSNEDSERDDQPTENASLKRHRAAGDIQEVEAATTKKRSRATVSKKTNRDGGKAPEPNGRGRPRKKKANV